MPSERATTTRLFVRLFALLLAVVLAPDLHPGRGLWDWVPGSDAAVAPASANPTPEALGATHRHEPAVAPAPFLKRAFGPALAPVRIAFGFDRNRFAWLGYLPTASADGSFRGPRVKRYCLMISDDPPRA